jgi:methyltransferase (TIGR00027 family)
MGKSTPLVTHVSDTARWVAVYRALESERADALFKDPYAGKLAGDQGRAIADSAQKSMRNGWPIVVRTKVIDDLIKKSIDEGCDRVLNLAAGLDTRPYRLELPSDLVWIEADLPAMVDEKNAFFEDVKPKCSLSREKVDLADDAARTAFLDGATKDAKKALVLTEGLLIYLEEPVVRSLARDLAARSPVAWWMFDLASPAILRMMSKQVSFDNAPLHFAPPNGVAFFEDLGWKALEIESALHQARRMRRLPFFLNLLAGIFPVPDPRNVRTARWSGIVRLGR